MQPFWTCYNWFLLSVLLMIYVVVLKKQGLSKKVNSKKIKVKQRNIATAVACLLEGLEETVRSFSASSNPPSLPPSPLPDWKEAFLSPFSALNRCWFSISFFFPCSLDLDLEEAVRRRFSPLQPANHWPRHSNLQSLTSPQSTDVLDHTQVIAGFGHTLTSLW